MAVSALVPLWHGLEQVLRRDVACVESCSYVLGPVVVWHEEGAVPHFTINVGAGAGEETVVGVFDYRQPG